MIPYLRARHRLAVDGALLAIFVFGCFAFGVLSVRRTTEGVLLTAALFCVVVYWVKPEGMVGVTLFGAFAALPEGLHVGKVFGPLTIYAYHLAAILAICYLIPTAKPRSSDFVLPGILVVAVLCSTATGFATGNPDLTVTREATTMIEMAIGFVLAMFVVYSGHVRWSIRVMIVILWFSAAMAIISSLYAIRLAGRAESLEGTTGAGQAVRIILSTQTPATAVLSALVAAPIVGRVRPMAYLALGVPALSISLLSFSRNTLISMGVAAAVALLGSLSWAAVRRAVVAATVGLAVVAVAVPGSLFLLQRSKTGAWLADQYVAFNQRVLGGVTSSALAVDDSALERLREINLLKETIAQAPFFGHGLGYVYQPPTGDDEFHRYLYPAYSHNFYLWWLAKAGAVGMAAFVLFALTPVILALRCAPAPAKISAAVAAGLLAISAVWPLPEMPMDALGLGMALGAAMGYAGLRRRDAEGSRTDDNPAPAATPDPPLDATVGAVTFP
ncbi:O-antigen ligase family protein [Mycobacterium intracellulare]|uniref:O-antigen ligase-related domain-containing protein n=2 Tax=Mycobacterium intracellulare TaxID=1767 RepID=A0A7R7MQZ4_MYCIT|nr:O-antigen ligase family protein [Mycobacterium intracellulare]AFC42229.1 O-antigen polymerase family protein [Mycobacterium intracellulare ATCC 13950]ETZ38719.1 O-Antigen ligase family protein [Mycobacterium intracellulare MIN_061107_1834]MCA2276437.1 O-antigen ligase family protein [Mycobacterium intracellulare]MCA2307499.1 O-antigen ligase family protein [Mycobacterium intracellulare subsp. chimaera]MCA2328039.1 O-antigen ligase family protein [Mycobacterium intracellulare]